MSVDDGRHVTEGRELGLGCRHSHDLSVAEILSD
jgi:hypothetical protein